jgi:hypothetical protein
VGGAEQFSDGKKIQDPLFETADQHHLGKQVLTN